MINLFVHILQISFDDSGREAVFGAGVKMILIPVLVLFLLAFVIRIGIYLWNEHKEKKKKREQGDDSEDWRRKY
ncbi:MAG: hypothetical protein J6T04_05745 [Bacteroidales bacterium]|nr:hypothetical protein [Bacteroidales bacterium]